MRLIDADALKRKKVRSDERCEWVVPVAEIDWMPTIEPARKTGKWIIEIEEEHTEKYDARIPHWFCSCCRTEYDPYSATRVNYCSHCGAKMEA